MTWGQRSRGGSRHAAIVHALCVATLALMASESHAQTAMRVGLGLNWVRLAGAEQCIASVDLMNRIEQRAGRILFVRTGEALLTLDGYVKPVNAPEGTAATADGAPYGWSVVFEVSDARGKVLGHRELGVLLGGDCSVVSSAADLFIDLLLDPEGVLGAGIPLEPETRRLLDELLHGEPNELDPSTLPKAEHAGAMTPKDAPKPKPTEASDAAPAEEATESYAYETPVTLALTGVLMLGTLPGLAKGVALHVMIPTRVGWAFELGLLTVAEQSLEVAAEAPAETVFGQQSASLVLCPPRLFSLWVVCAGAEYGRQSAVASDFGSEREVSGRDLFDLIAQTTFRVNVLPWLFLRASAALLIPLLRHDYQYDSREGDQRVFRISPVAGRVEAGLGLHI
jgi:hypothetical protein